MPDPTRKRVYNELNSNLIRNSDKFLPDLDLVMFTTLTSCACRLYKSLIKVSDALSEVKFEKYENRGFTLQI